MIKYLPLLLLAGCAIAPQPDPTLAMSRAACQNHEITGCLLVSGEPEDGPLMTVAKFSERWNAEHADQPTWQVKGTGL